MKILLVEDDDNKLRQVAGFLADVGLGNGVHEVRSYNGALRFLQESSAEVVLLDMSLPIFDVTSEEDGFQDDAFGGIEVLLFARRRKLKSRFIVLTQFETLGEGEQMISTKELGIQLAKDFKEIYIGIVYYNPSEASWRQELKNMLYDIGAFS